MEKEELDQIVDGISAKLGARLDTIEDRVGKLEKGPQEPAKEDPKPELKDDKIVNATIEFRAPTKEEALSALGLSKEQFDAALAAKKQAEEDAEESRFQERFQKAMEIHGLAAKPGKAASDENNSDKKEAKDNDEPQTWAAKVEADKQLAAGLSFESEWKRGEVDLSTLPDGQEAYILFARAEEKYGKEPDNEFNPSVIAQPLK